MRLHRTLVAAVVLSVVALLGSAASAHAQIVEGDVIDCTGVAVAGATAELFQVTGSGATAVLTPFTKAITTGARGEFGFGTVDQGTYVVRVRCPNRLGGARLQSAPFSLGPYRTDNIAHLRFTCCPTLAGNTVEIAEKWTTGPGGVITVTRFRAATGSVNAWLPTSMKVSDTISGVVVAEADETPRTPPAGAGAEVRGVVVEVGNTSTPPPAVGGKPARMEFSVVPTVIDDGQPSLELRLKQIDGRLLGRLKIPVQPKAPETLPPSLPTMDDYQFPGIGQHGSPTVIRCRRPGCFDGKSSTTSLAFIDARGTRTDLTDDIYVEGPGMMALMNPAGITGPGEIVLKDRNVETRAAHRILGLELTLDGPAVLNKGERRVLQGEITGLENLKETVPLLLVKSGAVSMQQGDSQVVEIRPGDVTPGGTYTITRTLTGLAAGSFSVKASTVVPDVCLGDKTGMLGVDSLSGAYTFCSASGPALSGVCAVSRKGGVASLQHKAADRVIDVKLDSRTGRGTASVKILSPKKASYTMSEAVAGNASCSCGGR